MKTTFEEAEAMLGRLKQYCLDIRNELDAIDAYEAWLALDYQERRVMLADRLKDVLDIIMPIEDERTRQEENIKTWIRMGATCNPKKFVKVEGD